MKKVDPKTTLLEHSEAKVRLYGKYLSAYLSILSKVQSIRQVFLFDLLCGEGEYENGAKGSPLIALDAIYQHYIGNSNTRPNLDIWFNDLEDSKIELVHRKLSIVELLIFRLHLHIMRIEFCAGGLD